MKMTPHAAFGTTVFQVQMDIGDERVVELGDNGLVTSGYYFYTKGLAKVKVIETDEELEDRTPGWLNYEHPESSANSSGNLLLTFPVETEWLCVPHRHNPNGLPNLKSLVLQSGENIELKNGTNLFLVRGALQINMKTFTGPCQIRVRSGDSVADCLETSYGMIFT
jgi:hypothetical protein